MKPLIIAEIGQNHNGDMRIARELIHIAKAKGADVAKFQVYDVDSIFQKNFKWYKEAKEAQLDEGQVSELAEECDNAGIEFMASVFDVERLEWMEKIGMKRYKIASRSISNKELIDAVARTGKDMLVSLGMWTDDRFPVIKTSGKVDFLYCVSKYPTMLEELNFLGVDFNKYSGFSDHTIGVEAAKTAMARGAKVIEKHFTLDKNMHGPDHSSSMDPSELAQLVRYAEKVSKILKG